MIAIDGFCLEIDTYTVQGSVRGSVFAVPSGFWCYFWIGKSENTREMGSNYLVRLAGFARTLVPRTGVFVAGRRRFFDSAQPGAGIQFLVALVAGRNVSCGRVANYFFNLVHVGLGRVQPTD